MDIGNDIDKFHEITSSIEVVGVLAGLGLAGFAVYEVIAFLRKGVFGSGSLPQNFKNATETLYAETQTNMNSEQLILFKIKRFFYKIVYAADISQMNASGAWFHIGLIEDTEWKVMYNAVMNYGKA